MTDYFSILSFLRVLGSDAEARHSVGLFHFGDRDTVQGVLIATTNQKEAVQSAEEVVLVHFRCRCNGNLQSCHGTHLIVEALALGQEHCRALGRYLRSACRGRPPAISPIAPRNPSVRALQCSTLPFVPRIQLAHSRSQATCSPRQTAHAPSANPPRRTSSDCAGHRRTCAA